MTRKRIFLHTGAHKTGTTAQQIWLGSHAGALRKIGLAYPTEVIAPLTNCHRMVKAMMKPPENRDLDDMRRLLQFGVFCYAADDRDVLLSAEDMSRSNHLPSFGEIGRFADEFGLEPVTLTFVRNQGEFTSSFYCQMMHSLRPLPTYSQCLRERHILHECDWAARAEIYRAAGCTMRFTTYGNRSKGNVVEQLLRLIGIGEDDIARLDCNPDRANISMGAIAIPVARHVALHLHASGARPSKQDGFRVASRIRLAAQAVGELPFVGPNAQDRAWLDQRYRSGNAAMRAYLDEDAFDRLMSSRMVEAEPTPSDAADLRGEARDIAAAILERVRQEVLADPDLPATIPRQLFETLPPIR